MDEYTPPTPAGNEPGAEPVAATAGAEDHSDPWAYAGEDAAAPTDTGRPAEDG